MRSPGANGLAHSAGASQQILPWRKRQTRCTVNTLPRQRFLGSNPSGRTMHIISPPGRPFLLSLMYLLSLVVGENQSL